MEKITWEYCYFEVVDVGNGHQELPILQKDMWLDIMWLKKHTTAYILATGTDYVSHHAIRSSCQFAGNIQIKGTYGNAQWVCDQQPCSDGFLYFIF